MSFTLNVFQAPSYLVCVFGNKAAGQDPHTKEPVPALKIQYYYVFYSTAHHALSQQKNYGRLVEESCPALRPGPYEDAEQDFF